MKLNNFGILMITGVLTFSACDKFAGSSNDLPVDVSGKVQGGYRHLLINLKDDTTNLVVYRGDYVKFYLEDQNDLQVEYPMSIPELGISAVLMDNSLEQPFFKMKTIGKYGFTIGGKIGSIDVVELRQSNYSELGAEEAWKLLLKNPPLVLDVRTRGEFSQGYIKDAVLIPLQEIQERAGELEMYQNQPILIYCATGNRSTTASKILLDLGFKNVMNLRMGIMGWASQGYNIEFR